MKKIFSVVIFFAAMSFWGCNADKQELILQGEEQLVTVRATIGNRPDSRVVLTQKADGNIKTEWKEGDAFFGVTGSRVIEYTDAVVNGSVASFTPNGYVSNGNKVNALYPLKENYLTNAASTDGFEISLAGQDGTLETLADYTYMTASATVEKGMLDFKFKNEIVVLRLTGMMFPADANVSSVSEIVVSGTGISDVAVANLSGDVPTVSVSATDNQINIKKSITVNNGVLEDVYVAFFPASNVNDLSITVLTNDAKPYRYNYDNSVNFEKGNVYTLSDKSLSLRYEPGDYYKDGNIEGVVVEVDKNGGNGKIISLLETKTTWMTGATLSNANVTSNKDDGLKNTEAITKSTQYAGSIDRFQAIKWCVKSCGNGWYLPALNEWTKVLANKDRINETLAKLNKTIISGNYWTSTQRDYNTAYISNGSYYIMTNSYSVRALHKF